MTRYSASSGLDYGHYGTGVYGAGDIPDLRLSRFEVRPTDALGSYVDAQGLPVFGRNTVFWDFRAAITPKVKLLRSTKGFATSHQDNFSTVIAATDYPIRLATASVDQHGWTVVTTAEPHFLKSGDVVAFSGVTVPSWDSSGNLLTTWDGSPLIEGSWVVSVVLSPTSFGLRQNDKQVWERTNLSSNPSVETNATGWSTVVGTGGVAPGYRSTGSGYAGTAAFYRMAFTTAPTSGYSGIFSPKEVVTPGSTYTVSVYVRPSVGTGMGFLTQAYSGAVVTATGTLAPVWCVANLWTRLSATVTTSPGDTGVQGYVNISGNPAAGVTIDADACLVEQTATLLPYIGTSTTATATVQYARTNRATNPAARGIGGTAGVVRTNAFVNPRSLGTTTAVTVRTNLCTNPNFETSTSGWAPETGATATRDTVSPISGTASLQLTTGGDVYVLAAVAVGEQVTVSLDYKTSGTVSGTPRIRAQAPGASVVEQNLPLTQTTPGRFSVTSLAATSAGNCIVAVFLPTSGGTIWIDNVLIEKAATALSYFDGASPLSSWAGTANLSTSIQRAGRVNLALSPRLLVLGGWVGVAVGGSVTATAPYSPVQSTSVGEVWSASVELTAGSVAWTGTFSITGTTAALFGENLSTTTAFNIPAGTTQRISVTHTTRTGTDGFRLRWTSDGSTWSGSKIDRVLIEKASSTGDYFDGGYSPSADKVAAWLGTADASASTLVGIPVANWSTNSAVGVVPVRATLGSGKATELLLSTGSIVSQTYLGFTTSVTATAGTFWSARVTLTAGPGLVPGRSVNVKLYASGYASADNIVTIPATGSIDVDVISSTALVGTSIGIYFYNQQIWNAGESVLVSNIVMEQVSGVGVPAGPYFDGATSPDPALTPAWTGTVDASTSTLTGVLAAGWTSGGKTYRTSYGGKQWAVAPTGTYTYGTADGVVGRYYSTSLRVRGTPGDTFTLPSSDFTAGSFVTSRIVTIPAAGEIVVSAASSQAVSSTGLHFGVSNTGTHQMYVTEALMEEAGGVGMGLANPYFDGSSPSSAWTGAVDASTSTNSDFGSITTPSMLRLASARRWVTDTSVVPGVEYYYSLWVADPTVPGLWVLGGDTSFIAPKDHSSIDRFFNALPPYLTNVNYGTLSQPLIDVLKDTDALTPGDPTVGKFLAGLAWEWDGMLTLADRVQRIWDPATMPAALLPSAIATFGLPNEPTFGLRAQRAMVQDAQFLSSARGTKNGLTAFVEALVGLSTTVSVGENLLLTTESSSFAYGTGTWAGSNCTLALTNNPVLAIPDYTYFVTDASGAPGGALAATQTAASPSVQLAGGVPNTSIVATDVYLRVATLRAHGLEVGDQVTVSGAASGFNLSGLVTAVPSATQYTLTPTAAPTPGSTTVGGQTGYNASAMTNPFAVTQGIPVTAGTNYQISFYGSGPGTAAATFYWWDAQGRPISNGAAATATALSSSGLVLVAGSVVAAPAGAAYLTPSISFAGGSTGSVFVLDGVMVTTGGTVPFEDARTVYIAMTAPAASIAADPLQSIRQVVKTRLMDNLQNQLPVGTAFRLSINGVSL